MSQPNTSWFSFFELDFLQMARVDCVRKTNFFEVVYLMSLFLFTLEVIAVIAELVISLVPHVQQNSKHKGKWRQVQAGCLIFAYFLYSPASSLLFQTFNCREIWDPDPVTNQEQGIHRRAYLQKDFSLTCDGEEYRTVRRFAVFMAAMIAMGLPLLYLYILYTAHHRKELTPGKRHVLEFFVRDYVPAYKYW